MVASDQFGHEHDDLSRRSGHVSHRRLRRDRSFGHRRLVLTQPRGRVKRQRTGHARSLEEIVQPEEAVEDPLGAQLQPGLGLAEFDALPPLHDEVGAHVDTARNWGHRHEAFRRIGPISPSSERQLFPSDHRHGVHAGLRQGQHHRGHFRRHRRGDRRARIGFLSTGYGLVLGGVVGDLLLLDLVSRLLLGRARHLVYSTRIIRVVLGCALKAIDRIRHADLGGRGPERSGNNEPRDHDERQHDGDGSTRRTFHTVPLL